MKIVKRIAILLITMFISLYKLSEIAKIITPNLKKDVKLRQRELNPDLHLKKLLESHNFENADQDCKEFFTSITNDNWFDLTNMPKKWSYKTWSESMRSMIYLFEIDEVKNYLITKLKIDQYNDIVSFYDQMRRKWMTLYRKSAKNDLKKNETIKIDDLETTDIDSELIDSESIDESICKDFNHVLSNQKLLNIVKSQISRIITARLDDSLLGASLNNVLDIIDLIDFSYSLTPIS